jgi:aconitate hydratase
MGVLPLQFKKGQNAASLGLTGRETFEITGIASNFVPGQDVQVHAIRENNTSVDFTVTSRIDTQVELDYYRNGGVLHTVLRRMLREE